MLHADRHTNTSRDVPREAACEDKEGVLETGANNDSGLVYHGSSLKPKSYVCETALLLCFIYKITMKPEEYRKIKGLQQVC